MIRLDFKQKIYLSKSEFLNENVTFNDPLNSYIIKYKNCASYCDHTNFHQNPFNGESAKRKKLKSCKDGIL